MLQIYRPNEYILTNKHDIIFWISRDHSIVLADLISICLFKKQKYAFLTYFLSSENELRQFVLYTVFLKIISKTRYTLGLYMDKECLPLFEAKQLIEME